MLTHLIRFSCLFLLSVPGWSDFSAGLKAYEAGDYATALKEWQPLAERGDANTQYNLGLLYARGQGMKPDYAEAAKWYRKAAEQGVAAAQYNLGVMYSNGQGVPQDAAEALKWFLKAAEQGVARAQNNLGTIYNEGEGAFKDFSEAEKWYRKAADKGIASAQFNLAVMYDLGQGVTKDYAEAIKWYRKAAEQGHASSQTNLGILYYNAQGTSRDLNEAYIWFSRAAAGGDPRAKGLLQLAANKMKPKDVTRCQELARNWHPVKQAVAEEPESPTPGLKAPAAPIILASSKEPTRQAPAPGKQVTGQAVWSGVDRIVAVGDVHGDYEQFVAVLQSAGLIDNQASWIGGKAHLVQTGDILDRGPDSREVMDLLMRLEKEAAAAGGYVHCLIGNHEAMNVYGDIRYVSPGEFAAFRDENSENVRESSFRGYEAAVRAKPDPDFRRKWELEHPPGFLEHRSHLGPSGDYGKWISSHNAVIKINDTLFLHAGISSKYAAYGIDQINQQVREELKNPEKLHGGIVTDEEGPLWYRGMSSGDEKTLAPVVQAVLENFGVQRVVIGHAYAKATITPRFGGKVLMIDIGLPRVYDNIGKLGCLVIEHDKPYALHRGAKLELPSDSGQDLLRYLKQAAALDPAPSPLLKRIAELGGQAQ